jgi:hypothetical protein
MNGYDIGTKTSKSNSPETEECEPTNTIDSPKKYRLVSSF